MRKNTRFGVEIECLVNVGIHNIDRGPWREGINVKRLNWLAESDSSINRSNCSFNDTAMPCEFISPVYNENEFLEQMDKFANYFSKKGKLKLNDVLVFNNSCGSHVHVSLGGSKNARHFYYKCNRNTFIKTRKYFFKKIRESSLSKYIQDRIIKQYNRSYSKYNWINMDRMEWKYDKHYEFNIRSEDQGKGIEWKGPNMLGIKTWDHFKEFWQIIDDCCGFLIDSSFN